ncbi:unnamed protein product [Ranitomeya imitator]|uniref:Uncharacterized protein n=1 Tax=Ranitomeya imitator TaxID=111125 RepID=A0ABN9LAP2_9NEOB|nr:unnamed protein product [Ranitomeya imitator]
MVIWDPLECLEKSGSKECLGSQDQKEIKVCKELQELLGCLDKKDLWEKWVCQVQLDQRENMVFTALLVFRVLLESKVKKDLKVKKVYLALAYQDLLAQRAMLELMVFKVSQVKGETKVTLVFPECLDYQDQKDHRALQGFQVTRVCLERKEKRASLDKMVFQDQKDNQVNVELRVHLAPLVKKENLDMMGFREHQGKRVNQVYLGEAFLDTLGNAERKVSKGMLDFLVHLEHLASLVLKVI